MANRPTFTILCCSQICIGVAMITFGIIDRTTVAVQCSYVMLPVWIGALAGFVGIYGLLIGRQNKRQGFHDREIGSAIKSINMICVGLSLITFYLYSSVLSYVGLREDFNHDNINYQNINYGLATVGPVAPLPSLPSGLYIPADSDTIQGIFSMVVILCLSEMFVGFWLAIINRNQMIFGYPAQQQGRQQPVQQVVQVPQVQHHIPAQQQQGYGVVQGNMNFPGNQAYMPGNQTQQPQYMQQRIAPPQPHPVMVTQNIQNMVPSNQNMVPSNQNVLPGNQNMSLSHQNMLPGNKKLSNQNMAPSNQNTFPSNQNPVLSNQNPILSTAQSEQTDIGATPANQDLHKSQENESMEVDSDKSKLL